MARIFRETDSDKSGSLSKAELSEAFKASGQEISDEELAMILQILDTNQDSTVTESELLAFALTGTKDEEKEFMVDEAFSDFDQNGDDLFDNQEFTSFVKSKVFESETVTDE